MISYFFLSLSKNLARLTCSGHTASMYEMKSSYFSWKCLSLFFLIISSQLQIAVIQLFMLEARKIVTFPRLLVTRMTSHASLFLVHCLFSLVLSKCIHKEIQWNTHLQQFMIKCTSRKANYPHDRIGISFLNEKELLWILTCFGISLTLFRFSS